MKGMMYRLRAIGVACALNQRAPGMRGDRGPANASNLAMPPWSDQSASWTQQADYSNTYLAVPLAVPLRPSRNPALFMGLTAVGAVLCVIWTFLPWMTVSDSGVTQSTDGVHEFPDCLEVCSSAPMSTWGLLLAVVAALTAGGCIIWLFTHSHAAAFAVVLGPPVIFALTFVDLSALAGNAQQVTTANGSFQDAFDAFDVTAGPGWFFTALTSATISILALIAVCRTGDVVDRSQSVWIRPLPVLGPPSDDLNEHRHYLQGYTQFTLPRPQYHQMPNMGP